jgi:pimeloyl-ACP methyl ester carboxylesterase
MRVSQHKKTWRRKSTSVAVQVCAVVLSIVSIGAGAQAATTTTTLPVHPTSSTLTWVDQNISFMAGSLKIYGTFRHPVGDKTSVPGVVLIAGSGPTDRNGNNPLEPGPVNTIKTLADWLSEDGVATLRYDKLGSGKTGAGQYAGNSELVGIAPFELESADALKYLAAQKGIDDKLLGVFGHSEGGLFALLLATGHAGPVPAIHALGLFEPLSNRYLALVSIQVKALVAAEVKAGQISGTQGTAIDATLKSAIKQIRTTGKVATNLPYGLEGVLNPGTAKFLNQTNKFDPKVLAGAVLPSIPVFVTCSNADTQVSCAEVGRIVSGLSSAGDDYDFVHLTNVDHVLKVDPTGSPANYTKNLPFSPVLKAALKLFVQKNL